MLVCFDFGVVWDGVCETSESMLEYSKADVCVVYIDMCVYNMFRRMVGADRHRL